MSTAPLSRPVPTSPLPTGSGALRLAGELDLASSADFALLERAVDACAGGRLVVDISEVTFIDAAALGALVQAQGMAVEGGGSLTLVGARPRIRRIFRLARVEELLDGCPES